MSTKPLKPAERDKLHSRMAEYLENRAADRKPRFQGNRVNYDFGAKRRDRLNRDEHKPCMVFTSAYRENYDAIFRR